MSEIQLNDKANDIINLSFAPGVDKEVVLKNAMNLALINNQISKAEVRALQTKFIGQDKAINDWLQEKCSIVSDEARKALGDLLKDCKVPEVKTETPEQKVEKSKKEVADMLKGLGITAEFYVDKDNGHTYTKNFKVGGKTIFIGINKDDGGMGAFCITKDPVALKSDGKWGKVDGVAVPLSTIEKALKEMKKEAKPEKKEVKEAKKPEQKPAKVEKREKTEAEKEAKKPNIDLKAKQDVLVKDLGVTFGDKKNKQGDVISNDIKVGEKTFNVVVGKDSGNYYLVEGGKVVGADGKQTSISVDDIKTSNKLRVEQIKGILKPVSVAASVPASVPIQQTTPAETAKSKELQKAKESAKDLLGNGYTIKGEADYNSFTKAISNTGVKMPEWKDLPKEITENKDKPISISFDGDKVNVYFGEKRVNEQVNQYTQESQKQEYVMKYGEIINGKFEKSGIIGGNFSWDNLENNNTGKETGKSIYFGDKVTYKYEGGFVLNDKGEKIVAGKGKYEWSNGVTFEGEYFEKNRKGVFITNNGKMDGETKEDKFALSTGTASIKGNDGKEVSFELKDGKLTQDVKVGDKEYKKDSTPKIYVSKDGKLTVE